MMTWIVWKVRTWFCAHQFVKMERIEQWWGGASYFDTIRVSATCDKCGFHRSYWKFR